MTFFRIIFSDFVEDQIKNNEMTADIIVALLTKVKFALFSGSIQGITPIQFLE